MPQTAVLEGSQAVSYAVRAARPQVISAYPISPQTHIVESLAQMVADGELDAQFVRVDSEFSAASVLAGASCAGSRAYTASSSQGLLLMTEVLYASAGQRLPFVLTGVNRSISAPITIQVDQQDTLSLRDAGLIQLYCEGSQEAYDLHLAAFKIAEHARIMLPVMVCMDGWILTHSYERIEQLDQAAVDGFLPPFKPANFPDTADPKTWGSYAEENVLMEFRYSIQAGMDFARGYIAQVLDELSALTGRDCRGLVEAYKCEDAEVVLVAMGSVCGTIKAAVDELRAQDEKVGLCKIRCYRPFPYEEIRQATAGAAVLAVLDADISLGSEGALAMDLKAKLCGRPGAPMVMSLVAGLGGREVNQKTVAGILQSARETLAAGAPPDEPQWVGLDPSILP